MCKTVSRNAFLHTAYWVKQCPRCLRFKEIQTSQSNFPPIPAEKMMRPHLSPALTQHCRDRSGYVKLQSSTTYSTLCVCVCACLCNFMKDPSISVKNWLQTYEVNIWCNKLKFQLSPFPCYSTEHPQASSDGSCRHQFPNEGLEGHGGLGPQLRRQSYHPQEHSVYWQARWELWRTIHTPAPRPKPTKIWHTEATGCCSHCRGCCTQERVTTCCCVGIKFKWYLTK